MVNITFSSQILLRILSKDNIFTRIELIIYSTCDLNDKQVIVIIKSILYAL